MKKSPQYKQSLEWSRYIHSKKICFLPHEALLTRERERLIVTYPLVHWILEGNLAQENILPSFEKDQIMIFCNFKPKYPSKKPSPDLMAFSAGGDILMIESKRRIKSDGKRDETVVRKLKKAAKQLAGYSYEFVEWALNFREDAYTKWSDLHGNIYVKIHEFPTLYRTLKECFSMESIDQQREYIDNIHRSISENRVHYGLAFNGSRDYDKSLDIDVPGYEDISRDLLYEAAMSGWDSEIGELSLYMVDHLKSNVISLNSKTETTINR